MIFDILHIDGSVKFTAEIDCDESASEREKIRLAVLWAIKNNLNLRYANLRYANLRYADLRYADLRYSDLRHSDLSYANLRYADLRYSDLSYADLSYSDFSNSDLRSADLRSADLIFTKTDIWECYIQPDYIRIGCQFHSVDNWRNFSNDEISSMDRNALDWWRRWKNIIFQIHASFENKGVKK